MPGVETHGDRRIGVLSTVLR